MCVEELEIHDEAAAEYDAAFEWYLERSPESAARFDQEVHRALTQIVSMPRSWAPGIKNTRRFEGTKFSIRRSLSRADTHSLTGPGFCALQPPSRILDGTTLSTGFVYQRRFAGACIQLQLLLTAERGDAAAVGLQVC